jgi:hypothetical protein
MYGGATTFTAHLIYKLGLFGNNISSRNGSQSPTTSMINTNAILRCTKRSEKKLREFGYGLCYQNVSPSILSHIRYPFLTIFKEKYFFNILSKLNVSHTNRLKDITPVIHDHRDISDRAASHIKNWTLVAIRRTVQDYVQKMYGLDCAFLYHPFYPYPVVYNIERKRAVSYLELVLKKT